MFDFNIVFSTFFFLLIFGFIYFLPLFIFNRIVKKEATSFILTKLYFSLLTLPFFLVLFALLLGNGDVDDYWNPMTVFTAFFLPILSCLSFIPIFIDSLISKFSKKIEGSSSEK